MTLPVLPTLITIPTKKGLMQRTFHWSIIALVSGAVLLLASGCSEEQSAPPDDAASPAAANVETVVLDRLPENRAGEVVQQAIDAAGGWDTWTDQRTVAYRKTTLQFDEDGNVEDELVQQHYYVLHPSPKMRIEWEEDGRQYLLVNDGEQAWKWVDGQRATLQEDRDEAWNSTFGSHYVFAMPFKLTDPGTKLSYAGQDTLSDGTVVDKVRADYEPDAGSAGGMHTWTYYFDADDHRLVANHLTYGPEPDDHSFTRYDDHATLGSLYLPTRRCGYQSNAEGEKLTKQSEIFYEDIRFNASLPDSLFVLSP